MSRQSWPKILLRLPEDARAFVAGQAERNASSLNSEIVRCIRDRMEDVSSPSPKERGEIQ